MKITRISSNIDFIVWLGVYFFLLILILVPIFSFSKGIVYPLDDVYIHLTMAKNLFHHGSWGVFPNENIAASSAPLYTLLLAPFTFSHEVAMFAPLILNIVVSIGILFLFKAVTVKLPLPTFHRIILGVLFILIIPLPSLTVMGMEHLLHSLFVVSIIANLSSNSMKQWILPLLTALSLFLRLETIFLLFGIGIWCLFEKKWDILLKISIGFFVGIGMYFLLSLIFSINLIPNTILLKTIINEHSFLKSTFLKVWNSKLLLFLSLLSVLILCVHWKKSKMFVIIALTTISHLVFARQGWFFRYEAYIIVLFFVLFVLEFLAEETLRKKLLPLFFALVFLLICSKRAYLSLSTTHVASKNIYDQQIQTAMIIKLLPMKMNIAVNDIGVVTYFNEEKQIVDLYGIATKEIFLMKQSNSYSSAQIRRFLNDKNIDILAVYTSWFEKEMFEDYRNIGTTILKNNVVCGDTIVSFYQKSEFVEIQQIHFP